MIEDSLSSYPPWTSKEISSLNLFKMEIDKLISWGFKKSVDWAIWLFITDSILSITFLIVVLSSGLVIWLIKSFLFKFTKETFHCF